MLSPTIGAALAEPLANIYRDAELAILERIARSLMLGLTADDWEVVQLQRLQLIRGEVLAALYAVNREAADLIVRTLGEAYSQGGLSAFQDVGDEATHIPPTTDQRALAVVALARETSGAVATAQRSVLRAVDDVYARVIGEVASVAATGAIGRQSAVQRALDAFLGKGLTFIDTKRGQLNIADYAQMALRTAAARTALQGHIDTQRNMGLDLTVIHPGPRACDICDKWARAILTTGTQTGVLRFPNMGRTTREGEAISRALSFSLETNYADGTKKARDIGGQGNSVRSSQAYVSVKVEATLDEARAAGWGHPNCRCALRAYLPGITSADIIERPAWDADAYKAQQRQRAIERQIRGWKTRQAIAVTDEAKLETGRRVKAWQGAMREHLAKNDELKRQGSREQIGDRRGL